MNSSNGIGWWRHVALVFTLALALFPAPSHAGAQPASSSDVKIWPLFYHATDPVSDTSRTELLWPLYVNEQTANYSVHQFLSFPQRYPTAYPHQFYLGWPLSGLRMGRGGHDAWLFPFLWSSEDHFTLFPFVWYGRRYFSLFPLFYYGRSGSNDHPQRTLNLALLQHNSWSDKGRTHALWPLAWYKRYDNGDRHSRSLGVFPLFWNRQSSYSNSTSRSESRFGRTLLLQGWRWNTHASQSRSRVSTNSAGWLFPFYYRSTSQSQKRAGSKTEHHFSSFSQCVVSLRQSSQSSEIAADGTETVVSAETRKTFFPVWWQWRKQFHDSHHGGKLLFPFWWQSKKIIGDTLEESARFWIPIGAHLYKKGVYETRNILGPVFNRTENKVDDYVRYDAFFPFFSLTRGSRRSGGRVFPFVGREQEIGNYANLWYLFPFGWDTESQERPQYRISTPEFWALHELERRPFVASADCPNLGPRRLKAFYPFAWSYRSADVQIAALLPLWYQTTWRHGKTISRDRLLPLLLGMYGTSERDGERTYSRHDYLLSLLAWGKGERYRLNRLFPLWSYRRYGQHRRLSMLIPPFSRSTWRDSKNPEQNRSSSFSMPFSFLPVLGSRYNRHGTNAFNRSSWCFPFYKYSNQDSPERKVKKLSILWPLWNSEWERGETRSRSIGGLVHDYERDVNHFVEQRILYRLFTRRTRSWFSELEMMPFYSSQKREDGNAYWKVLGGLVGREIRGGQRYLRLLYLPIRMGQAPRSELTPEQRATHADLAVNYVKHGRYDRAAIEFTLAGQVHDDDLAFQMTAAEAYLDADPDAIGKELRSSVPSSLESLVGKSGYRSRRDLLHKLRQLAIERYEAAIALGGDEAAILQQIAVAYADMDLHVEALQNLIAAAALKPGFGLVMARLDLLGRLGWKQSHRSPDQPVPASQMKWREDWFALLADARRDYPDSPSLCRVEAEGPAHASDNVFGYVWGPYRYHYRDKDLFSDDFQRRLKLFERGATLDPGLEESAWLEGEHGALQRWHKGKTLFQHFRPVIANNNPGPRCYCAQQAIGLLNRQVDHMLNAKQYEKAATTFERILVLLPNACSGCVADHAQPDFELQRDSAVVAAAMRNIYRYYVHIQKDPNGYLALAEDWSGRLCPHQQVAIENSTKPLQLELQYLKNWKIVHDNQSLDYQGDFFDRYVDLDALLGQPDDCTATASCTLVVPSACEAVLRVGFDHRLSITLNGKQVFGDKKRKIAVRDEFTIPIRLKEGQNQLKLTLEDDKLAFGFFLRLSDTNGNLMKDIIIQR